MSNGINFLKGKRFTDNANDMFRMTIEDYESIDFSSQKWIEQLERYKNKHLSEQVPRLKELKRYSLADNNIKYRNSKKDEDAADNRIASDFGNYITIFEQGYMLGRPVQYKNEDSTLQELITNFSTANNEDYHNVLIKTDLSIYGRAYELLTVKEADSKPFVKLIKLDAEETFVIYDDTHDKNSLMAIRYYRVDYGDSRWKDFVVVYTDTQIHYYVNDNQKTNISLEYVDSEYHLLGGVPVNEYLNNENRTGAYESVLDSIDAYDLSQSELANFQQDMMDAMLVISGNPYTGVDDNEFDEDGKVNPNSRLGVTQAFKRARILILDDNPNPGGATPSASYLVKEYDAEGAEVYKKRLVNDILRFTFTPDTTDESFSGNRSGESMKYKLMASDNRRAMQQRLFKKGLLRRLRLAVNIWRIQGNLSEAYDNINTTSVIFTPNVPKTEAEIVSFVTSLVGLVSEETLHEILYQVTGVKASDESVRMAREEEKYSAPSRRLEDSNDNNEVLDKKQSNNL